MITINLFEAGCPPDTAPLDDPVKADMNMKTAPNRAPIIKILSSSIKRGIKQSHHDAFKRI